MAVTHTKIGWITRIAAVPVAIIPVAIIPVAIIPVAMVIVVMVMVVATISIGFFIIHKRSDELASHPFVTARKVIVQKDETGK